MQTYTQTATSTYTYARHIAAKVAADLKRLQRLYGINCPSDQDIDDYQTEMSMLLDAGYLGEVTYGFKRDGKWVFALKYRATGNQLAGAGDDPGGLRPSGTIENAYFTSFLHYSSAWWGLSDEDKNRFRRTNPVRRVDGEEPGLESGSWEEGRRYASGELGVQRSMIRRHSRP